MRIMTAILAALLLSGCPKPADPSNVKTIETKPVEGAAMTASFLSLKHNGERFMGKPPMKTFYLDASLKNEQKTARWVLIQNTMPDEVSRPEGGVDALQLYEPPGTGKVIAIELMGTNLYGWAFLLPAGAEIVVKNIVVTDWSEDIPTELQVKAISASSLAFGGKDAASYFKADPSCDAKAEVTFDRSKSSNISGTIRFSEDYKELPMTFTAEQTQTLTVPVLRKN